MSEQKIWTATEIEELKRLQGTATSSEIATQMGRSKDSVKHKLKWLLVQSGAVPAAPNKTVAVKPNPIGHPPPVATEPKPIVKRSSDQIECMNCGAYVVEWDSHLGRMGIFVCVRP